MEQAGFTPPSFTKPYTSGETPGILSLADEAGRTGRREAGKLWEKPGEIPNLLNALYQRFLEAEKLDQKAVEGKKGKLRQEIQQLKEAQPELRERQAAAGRRIADGADRLADCQAQRALVEQEEAAPPDTIPFAIATVATGLLTLFIFLFYFLVGYSVFAEGNPLAPDSLTLALSSDKAVLQALLPVLFLSLGILIHVGLDKKLPGLVAGLVVFTFAADALMGYIITKRTLVAAYDTGSSQTAWPATFGEQVALVLADPNFYLVLLLGFVAYMIWGGLLHYLIVQNRAMQPDHLLGRRLAEQDRLVEAARQAHATAYADEASARTALEKAQAQLAGKEADLIRYQNGTLPIDTESLKTVVAAFTTGWNTIVNEMTTDAGATEIANQGADKWLTGKLAELRSDF